MPSVEFDARLVFDIHFYNKIIKSEPKLLMKLMHINSKSKGYKRESNIMSKKIFDRILEENQSLPRSLLRASFFDIDELAIESIEDEVERVIKYAIHVVDQPPRKSFILTSEEMEDEYKNNQHYQGVKEISVKSGQEAVEIINEYFGQCTTDW